MNEYWFLCGLLVIAMEFWQRRRQAELAERLVNQYCGREQWQFISIARHEAEILPLLLRMLLRKPSCFTFEYSEAEEDKSQGELFLTGLRHPLFRVHRQREHADNVIPFPTVHH